MFWGYNRDYKQTIYFLSRRLYPREENQTVTNWMYSMAGISAKRKNKAELIQIRKQSEHCPAHRCLINVSGHCHLCRQHPGDGSGSFAASQKQCGDQG